MPSSNVADTARPGLLIGGRILHAAFNFARTHKEFILSCYTDTGNRDNRDNKLFRAHPDARQKEEESDDGYSAQKAISI